MYIFIIYNVSWLFSVKFINESTHSHRRGLIHDSLRVISKNV